MGLAFRLFGTFQWPPSPVLAACVDEKSGILEVWFLPTKDGVRGALRWVPRVLVSDDPLIPDDVDEITKQSATAYLSDKGDTTAAFWIDSAARQSGLTFRGAFVIEQTDGKTSLDLQLPLVNGVVYGNVPGKADKSTVATYSGLRVFEDAKTGPTFALHLHLPLPVRQSKKSDARAFPLTLHYLANLASEPKTPVLIHRVFGGWTEDDGGGGSSVELHPQKPAGERWFGNFGFSERGNPNPQYAIYQGTVGSLGDYWPFNNKCFVEDVVNRYGFSVSPRSWLGPSTNHPADLSLRFRRRDSGPVTGLTYRVRVDSEKGAASDGSDIVVDQIDKSTRMLRIKLSPELGGRRVNRLYYGTTDGDHEVRDVEGWLRTGERLAADCTLAWDIQERQWSETRTQDWLPTVTVSLNWLERISAIPADGVASGAVFQSGLLGPAAYSFRQVRAAMLPGEAGLPTSFLPDLDIEAAPTDARFCLYGTPLAATIDEKGLISWGRQNDEHGKPLEWRRPPTRLSLASKLDTISGNGGDTGELELWLVASSIAFFRSGRTVVTLKLKHDDSWPLTAPGPNAPNGFFASFAVESSTDTAWSGRLASLDFTTNDRLDYPGDDKETPDGHIRIGGIGGPNPYGSGGPQLLYPQGRIAAELRLPLPVSEVVPITVDVPRFDRSGRPAPLLINLSAAEKANALQQPKNPIRYWLLATETLLPREDRKLTAEVFDRVQEIAAPRSYAVLSTQPFSVFRFTDQPISARGDQESTSVAAYSGDDRVWQYKLVSRYYRYSLPPQVIGESADKPRRLEIHDLVGAGDVDDKGHPLPVQRPFVRHDRADGSLDEAKSDRQRRAVEYRLTPSAELWIEPSDVARGYFMPEASAHDIFRQYGAFGLGAALAYLRAEFLYGLSVGIDVSKESTIARGARVAEIEALVGHLTGAARNPDADPALTHRWDALRDAVARRPERLEIWARDFSSEVDFAPARFSEGTAFALRGTALHRAPIIDGTANEPPEGVDAYNGWPMVGREAWPPVGLAEDAPTPPRDPTLPRLHPQGLSGGALWPVESLNLLNALLISPQSNGGTIEGIALSPTGGDASQKAEFLGGKVTIISETYNGRVQRQQVEVLGRICALWHRAKHVVVYERTVNPSAQFAPKDDPKASRSRRPILRKVREYIQIIEDQRPYPDFSTATARSAGFLKQINFVSKIINVDSAWSSEVGDFGWQIPLWNKLAARERPQVYPLPPVSYRTLAEGDAEPSLVAQNCLDADQLYFFADFKATTSNTDLWATRLGLDFPNMPAAKVIADVTDIQSASGPISNGRGPEPRRRPVTRILPGLRRFTWRLAPAAQKTVINGGRAGKPLFVGLDSVSFMRASHQEKKELTGALITAAGVSLGKPAGDTLHSKLAYWASDGSGAPPGEGDGAPVLASVASSLAKLKDVDPNDAGQIKAVMKSVLDVGQAALADDFKKLKPKVDFDNVKGLASGIESGALCQKLKDDATSTIRRKELLVRTAIADWLAELDDALAAGQEVVAGQKADLIKTWTDKVIDHIRPLFEEASQDISKIEEGVEKARAILVDVETEIDSVFLRARSRLEQFRTGYDENKPWSPARRKAFREGAEATVRGVVDDVSAAIEEAAQRLSVELGNAGQQIAGHIAKALRAIDVSEAEIVGRAVRIEGIADRLLQNVDAEFAQLLDAADGAKGKLAKLQEKVDIHPSFNPPPKNEEVKARLDQGIAALTKGATAAAAKLSTAKTAAKNLDTQIDEAAADFEALLKSVTAALKDVGEGVTELAAVLVDETETLIGIGAQDLADEIGELADSLFATLGPIAEEVDTKLGKFGSAIDAIVKPMLEALKARLGELHDELSKIPGQIAPIAEEISSLLSDAQNALSPAGLLKTAVKSVVTATLEAVLEPLPPELDGAAATVAAARRQLGTLADDVAQRLHDYSGAIGDQVAGLTEACAAVSEGIQDVEAYFKELAGDYLESTAGAAYQALNEAYNNLADAKELLAAAKAFDRDIRRLHNDVSRVFETADAYGQRVFDAVSNLGQGGLLAAPSSVLKLYSAVTSAPELAALKADIDRIRSTFDELDDIIGVTKSNAMFSRLGDELKAMGLSIPFDRIGDRLLPADLSNLDIGSVFRNFGGAKLDRLFKGYKIPDGVRDAIKITHDFDKKQARAWVQVDIAAPFPGRRSLFSLGVFKADFVDMQLTGRVRLEAASSEDKVAITGFGRIATTLDTVVSGQSMVKFEKFGLEFTKEKGLDVQFDPKNAKLNPQFKWIQDFLSSLFPELGGGFDWIRENGIPVGIQHDFVLPPLSLTFGTSGVSNISLANHFKLVAFPDFIIADRFNLSSVERPFIFSVFIIGGTGYLQVEAEYNPVRDQLMVLVEAGAGGSAQLAFAFGPFIGQVFITISGVLSYRKLLGKSGGGLSISMVLVITGQVDVCGIVTVGITLMLRMSYRDNGQVDADGTLTVTTRISRFFKITARGQVKYKVRGGKSETSSSGSVTPSLAKLAEGARRLESAGA